MTKVLIVEDDKKIALALQLRLKSVGYKVSMEHCAKHALIAAVNDQPDVVLLDINLPDGDGISIASRMRAISKTSKTPVIFITASMQAGIKERAANLGAIAFLEKPFDSAQLIEAIEVSRYSIPAYSAKRRCDQTGKYEDVLYYE